MNCDFGVSCLRLMVLIVFVLLSCMNILHAISANQEVSPQLQKLKTSCKDTDTCSVKYSKDELKEKLTPLQYHVTQEKGTERAFTGKYTNKNDEGIYTCVVCGNPIFSHETKYNSKSGWPAFYDVTDQSRVQVKEDVSHGMDRLEVVCSHCGAHLGHVFDDGPQPTGLRYCINSAALNFQQTVQKSESVSELRAHDNEL